MVGCTAFGCSNRSEKGYRMYGFPKDQERSKRWMAMGSRQNLPMTGASNSRKLCHVHFEDDQFTSTKTGGKLKLRPDAVPTLFIHRPKPKRRKPPFERAPPAPIQTTTDHTYYAKLNFGQPAYEMMETDPDTEITRTNTALSARRRKREKRKNTLQPAEGEGEQHTDEETHKAGGGETHKAGGGETHKAGGGETHKAGGGETHKAGGGETHKAGGGETHKAGGGETHKAGGGETHIAGETHEAEGRSEQHTEEETQNPQEVTVTQTECNFRVHRCAEAYRLLEENRPHLGIHLDHPYAMNCQESQGQIPVQLSEKTFTNTWEIFTEATNEPSFSGTQTTNSLLSPVVSATLEESYVTGMDVPVTCVQGKERVDVVHLPNVDSGLRNDHQTSVNFSVIAPGGSQSLLTSTLQHSVPQQRLCSHNCKTLNKPCHTKMPPVENKCPLSHKDVRNPFPKCTKLGLNLNVRPKEKLDLTLLTNGVMVEIHNFASKIRTAFRFVVFDILDHNFDLGLLSEQRWRFVDAINWRIKEIKKKCNNKHFFLNEVFTLPDLQKKIKPISKAALLAKASRDNNPYMTLKQKLAKQKKIQYRKRRYVSKYQIARDQEKAIKFEKAHEAINKFLMTWFYHNKQLPFLNTSESMSDQTDDTSYTTETSTLSGDELDPHPLSFGQVNEEHISCEAAVTGWAGETPVQMNEESQIDIKVDSDLVLSLQSINTELHLETFETLCTSEQAVPCQKDEPCDVSIKDEPDFHPISWSQTKEEPPWNRTEDTDRIGELPQNHGLNIVSITNESDLHLEKQGHVRTLEQSSLPHRVERTFNNPYPYCRRIGLDLVKSNLGVKKKLDLHLLTMGVMIEIHDFAKEVCASSKEICVSVLKEHFHLDLEKEKFLCSKNLEMKIKRFTKNYPLKEKFLNEPFSFSIQVQKPCQRTSRRTALPNASLLLKNQRFKDISEKRRSALKKKKEEIANMWAKEKEKPAIK